VEKTSYEPGTPSWIDLGSPDPAKAAGFYSELFGWDVIDLGEEAGGYRMASVAGQPVAGLGAQMNPAAPPYWTTYIAVADADASAAAVKAAGGTVFAEPFDVMDAGRMAVFADPTGAAVSVWQAGTHSGSGRVNEHGAMCWHELQTRDPEAAKAFYATVFGWGTAVEEMDGADDYFMWKLGETTVGGLMVMGEDFPSDVPSNWLVYFAVDDCDAAVARVAELGGSVHVPPTDIPPGRFAVVSDPDGAMFSVIKLTPPEG